MKEELVNKKMLTVAVLYHNDVEHLTKQISSWNSLDSELKRCLLFLIVDDGSSDKAVEVTKRAASSSCSIDIVLVRVVQNIRWNIGGARNLAMQIAPTKYVFLTDIDIYAPNDFHSHLLELTQEIVRASNNGIDVIFSSFRRVFEGSEIEERPHPALMLLSKDTYWRVGGCDEDFVGNYGYTDPHFWHRARRTPNVSIVESHSEFPQIPTLVEKSYNNQVNRQRNTAVNMALFEHKTQMNDWSDTYLRFDWIYEQPACMKVHVSK